MAVGAGCWLGCLTSLPFGFSFSSRLEKPLYGSLWAAFKDGGSGFTVRHNPSPDSRGGGIDSPG